MRFAQLSLLILCWSTCPSPASDGAIFRDSFDSPTLSEHWVTHPEAFQVKDGYLEIKQQPLADHGALGEVRLGFVDAVIQFRFRYQGETAFNLLIQDARSGKNQDQPLCRLRIAPEQIMIVNDKREHLVPVSDRTDPDQPEEPAAAQPKSKSIPVDLKPDVWHDLVLGLTGRTVSVVLNGKPAGFLTSHEFVYPQKSAIGFYVLGEALHIDDFQVTLPGKDSPPGHWPLTRLQSELPTHRIEDPAAPIQSILYSGEPVDGKNTEVFAFYASPKTLGVLPPDQKVPGIVLIHGGGGTAFSDWVWQWAQRGYAAIAMDLSGHRPPAPVYDENGKKIPDLSHPREQRMKLDQGGLDQSHAEKFSSIGGGPDDDWPYHAVANVMRAHTLLRNFPEVDASKTAVTGISWGGYTTCLVAALDHRFKAAVPVYGCGFLHQGESIQKPALDALGELAPRWVTAYDPSSHLAKTVIPTLWVNGTTDQHYPLDSYAKSYRLVPGAPRTFRILPGMSHSHTAGMEPEEIGWFVDSVLKGTAPLARLGLPELVNTGEMHCPIEQAEVPLVEATLHYTTDGGPRSERNWQSLPAQISENTLSAPQLPAEANTWLFTAKDERGAIVSSQVGFASSRSTPPVNQPAAAGAPAKSPPPPANQPAP